MNDYQFFENQKPNQKIDETNQACYEQKADILFKSFTHCTNVQPMDQVAQDIFRCAIWEELTRIGDDLCSFLYLWRDDPKRLSFFIPSYDEQSELWHYLYSLLDRLQDNLEHWWEKEIEQVAVKHAASEDEHLDFEDEIPDDVPW